jgi:hypothetical protein
VPSATVRWLTDRISSHLSSAHLRGQHTSIGEAALEDGRRSRQGEHNGREHRQLTGKKCQPPLSCPPPANTHLLWTPSLPKTFPRICGAEGEAGESEETTEEREAFTWS